MQHLSAALKPTWTWQPRQWRIIAATLTLGLVVPAAGAVDTSAKASAATGAARTTIIRPITVSSVRELNFGKLQYTGSGPDGSVVLPAKEPSVPIAVRVTLFKGSDETPLIRSLVGEPGRIYRIGLPVSVLAQPAQLTVNTFTLWSATRGDITGTRLGAFDLKGNDTLRLGATLVVPKGTKKETYAAVVPVTISYE